MSYPYQGDLFSQNKNNFGEINQPKNQSISHQQNYPSSMVHNVQVKSTFNNKGKTIEINPHQNKFYVHPINQNTHIDKKNSKQFPLDQIIYKIVDKNNNENLLHVNTNSGKKYVIGSQNVNQIAKDIDKGQTIHQINQFQEHPINFQPKNINYNAPFQPGINMNIKRIIAPTNYQPNYIYPQNINIPYLNQQPIKSGIQQNKNYPRRKKFINEEDWVLDTKRGGLIFINQQKKSKQSKIIGFIIKKFLKTGSFMGISFPTFAMKPQGILQTYAKAVGCAPILFQNVTNSVQKMKKFIAFIHSFSIIFADMQKPFNPVLGQTFQAKVADGHFSAQQISHHPPISAFMYEGKNYKISGAMQLSASIGANSATGLFLGDLKITFKDGSWLVGKVMSGQLSGFMIGQNKFQAIGSSYAYDNKKLICSFSAKEKGHNNFVGYIGKLQQKYKQQFKIKIKHPQRFSKFPFYERKCFQIVYSSMEMIYNSHTAFDGKQYINLHSPSYLPFLPEKIDQSRQILLKSDSRLRKDIELLKQKKYEQSQTQKQRIQESERFIRKLRAKYDPWHHSI